MATEKNPVLHNGVDLSSSAAANSAATFRFNQESALPIAAFRCCMPMATSLCIKQWLIEQYDAGEYAGSDLLRCESLELEAIQTGVEGTLLLLEGIATVHSPYASRQDTGIAVGIMALLMPGDHRIRFFYSVQAWSTLLVDLENQNMTALQHTWEPGTRSHLRILTFIREEFRKAVEVPDHPDYINAANMEDCAPDIREPDTALDRLQSSEVLYWQQKEGRDLSDDRYLLQLHPAERWIASMVELHCAEYLFVKRTFFKEFYVAVYRSDKNVEKGERARTDHAHQKWLEEIYHWTPTRAKKLVTGWKLLGLLDEKRFLPWIKQGGMLAETEFWGEE